MKSFDFSQLKMDCLNPVCIDGSALEHKGKALHFHNITELDEYISTLTAEMCQARKDNVKLIEPDYQEVQQSIPELIVWAESIKKHTMLFLDSSESSKNLTNDKCRRILEYCDAIIEKAKEYKLNIETMYNRFRNGTIRISAVGAAGQGKSTFAKYYTGLSNGVIPTHKKENEETTGTVCTLIHTDSNTIKHIASYYTQQDILDTLNYYLEEIKEVTGNKENSNFRLMGLSKFEDFEKDFIRNIGKLRIDEIPNNSKLTTDIRKGLEAFFAPTELVRGGYWYNFLGKEDHELRSNDEQLQHILMSDPTKLYLAVKEVKTYIRFPKNGEIFKNFEIVDTKGVGSAAGAHASKEVYSAIDSSDAVFSIQSVTSDVLYTFYNKYLLSRYAGDEMFRRKHFMILNPYIGSDYNIAVNTLQPMKLSDITYCGSLYARECHRSECVKSEHDDNLDCILTCPVNSECQSFVDYVVRNMLLRVSTMVYELDKDRIDKRRNDRIELATSINNLSTELMNTDDYIYKSREDVVENIVRGFLKQTHRYIMDIPVSDVENADKEYVQYVEEGNEITLYDIITSETGELRKSDKRFTRSHNEDVDDFIRREIREGLKDSYETFARHFIDKQWIEEEQSGGFIEDFGDGLSKRIARVMSKLNTQKELDPKVREEISSEIWSKLNLNVIFPETNGRWQGKLLRESKLFGDLDGVFAPRLADDQAPKPLFTPYLMLYKYFKGGNSEFDLPEIEDEVGRVKGNQYLKKERLIDVAVEILYKIGIHKLIENIYNSHSERNQRKRIKETLSGLVGVQYGYDDCKDFYSMYSELILSDEEIAKINLATSWQSIKDINKKIQTSPFVHNCIDNNL